MCNYNVLFGYNLKLIRSFLGYSLKDVALKTGLTPSAICQIEKGKRSPNLKTILKICDAFNCKFEAFMRVRNIGDPQ